MSRDNTKLRKFLSYEDTEPYISNTIAQVVIDVGRAFYGEDYHTNLMYRYAIAAEVQRRLAPFMHDEVINNLERARKISWELDELRQVQKDLKGAFAHRQLDGGATAALTHPLYLQAEQRIAELEEELTILI